MNELKSWRGAGFQGEKSYLTSRRVWRNQRGNTNPYIEQTTQQPEEKAQMDKQRIIKHTHKNKDRVTRTPLKTWVNSCGPKGLAVLVPLVPPVVLI